MCKPLFLSAMAVCVLTLGLFSCATAPEKTRPGAGAAMSVEQQDKEALALFQKVYETLEAGNRAAAIPEVERMYREIIEKYPDAALVQESYWRLILIYLNDFTPPAYDKAEEYYARFAARFKGSIFDKEIDTALSDAYYRNGQWERLLKHYTPAVRQYVRTGKPPRPHEMLMYAEAKFRLRDFVEAEKGFKIVVALFPRTRESAMANDRIEEIRKSRTP